MVTAIGELTMEQYYVYILQSETTGRYYCGQTKNLQQRLRHHNDPDYRPDATTRRFKGPWILVWSEQHKSRSSAMLKERRIKKRGIGRFLGGEYHPAEGAAAGGIESRRWRD